MAIFSVLQELLEKEQAAALATVIAGPGLGSKMLIRPDGSLVGGLGTDALNRQVLERAADLLAAQKNARFCVSEPDGQVEVFVEVFPPPPKLIILGAVHVAIHLVSFARTLGFRTIVIDPRSTFATPERFCEADELLVQWPTEAVEPEALNESAYVAVLSHDERLDNPFLIMALNSPCRYIGVLGSRKTHARRVRSLKAMGATDEQLRRIHAPIGMDLGGRRPEEIALAIMAEIVAVRNSKSESNPLP